MRYRYEPTPEAIAQVRDDLKPFIHDPAAYSHELADMLIAFGLILAAKPTGPNATSPTAAPASSSSGSRWSCGAHDAIQPTFDALDVEERRCGPSTACSCHDAVLPKSIACDRHLILAGWPPQPGGLAPGLAAADRSISTWSTSPGYHATTTGRGLIRYSYPPVPAFAVIQLQEASAGWRGVSRDRQADRVEVVAYNPDAGLMSVRIGNAVYVLDKDDLAMTGAVLVRLLADGRRVDPDILPALLRRDA